jgi:hypothetical protein
VREREKKRKREREGVRERERERGAAIALLDPILSFFSYVTISFIPSSKHNPDLKHDPRLTGVLFVVRLESLVLRVTTG